MARKVFISFLGTNNYVLCKYNINGKNSKPVRFVQEALIENLCMDWTAEDRIFIFCTSKDTTGEVGSKEINWLDNGQSNISEDIERIGLQHRIQDLQREIGLSAKIEQFDIESGFNENEIWNIFNKVYTQLQPEDEIYFDVTHAFRSIPLFSIVLFNYSKFMKSTRLRTILYGAFEKLGPAYKVKEMPIEQRVAPVIDMTNIARLQEYNQIAGNLKVYGKVKQLQTAIHADKGNTIDKTIDDLADSIKELDEYIATIDLRKIKSGKYIVKFRNNYRNITKKKKLKEPIQNILTELYKETEDFVNEDSFQNIEAAINWTIKHDMIMQTFPLAEEYIVLRLASMLEDLRPKKLSSKKFRMIISDILGMPVEDFINKNWKNNLADLPDVADDISEDFLIKELRPHYEMVRTARNSLAHGNGSISYQELNNRIPYIFKCMEYLNAEYQKYPSTIYIMSHYVS